MFNDLSSTPALLATRRSGKARDIGAPGPDAAKLARILAAATRVPDHGKLAPWRFLIVPDDKRGDFARLLQEAHAERQGGADRVGKVERDAIDAFAHQAPCLIVVLSTPVRTSTIPIWEQELSVGAACQNLLVATHAEGFVGNWLTGWAAFSDKVRDAFGGGDGDRIAGFFFLGSPLRAMEERPRPDPAVVIGTWQGF